MIGLSGASRTPKTATHRLSNSGQSPGAQPVPGCVRLDVTTRHPEDYVLLNEEDGTRWRSTPQGGWVSASNNATVDRARNDMRSQRAGARAATATSGAPAEAPEMDLARLAKADTVALWHAVDNYALMVGEMRSAGFSEEQLQAEGEKVMAARRALRKVNAIRRTASRGGEK